MNPTMKIAATIADAVTPGVKFDGGQGDWYYVFNPILGDAGHPKGDAPGMINTQLWDGRPCGDDVQIHVTFTTGRVGDDPTTIAQDLGGYDSTPVQLTPAAIRLLHAQFSAVVRFLDQTGA